MSNKITNRQIACEVLCEHAKSDMDIVVLCSDSRGSASLTPFAEQFPGQFVEVGIAEQDLVGIAAGLAKMGKKPYAASPASFLSTRSYHADSAGQHREVLHRVVGDAPCAARFHE